jgi:hypothetical protein
MEMFWFTKQILKYNKIEEYDNHLDDGNAEAKTGHSLNVLLS